MASYRLTGYFMSSSLMNIKMQDMPKDLSIELRSYLMPLDFFYSKNNYQLPKISSVSDLYIPDVERNLLAHNNDMTSTLSNHHGSDLYIEVLDNQFNDNYLLRMVVLKKTNDHNPVEFGAIGINLSSLDNMLVTEINEGRKPLGKLLEQYSVNYLSNPRAYFEIEIDAYISKILCTGIGEIAFGRCNEITDNKGFTIADIVEVLPQKN